VREELKHEAFQFVREQRIRCLLRGCWFPRALEYNKAEQGPVTKQDLKRPTPAGWRYVRLSHNRRYVHYADFDTRGDYEPALEVLSEKSGLNQSYPLPLVIFSVSIVKFCSVLQ
jgi:engulfment/cell motility protein 1